jgi:hypothetical protein
VAEEPADQTVVGSVLVAVVPEQQVVQQLKYQVEEEVAVALGMEAVALEQRQLAALAAVITLTVQVAARELQVQVAMVVLVAVEQVGRTQVLEAIPELQAKQ